MTEAEMRKWIDEADHETLLRKWRFAPVGDPLLAGDVGKYFAEVMGRKRREAGQSECIRASKAIGWKE